MRRLVNAAGIIRTSFALLCLCCSCVGDSSQESGWTEGMPQAMGLWDRRIGHIYCENACLYEVIYKLEYAANRDRLPELRIRVTDMPRFSSESLTLELTDVPLTQALSYIAEALDCRVRHRENVVVFYIE